MIRTYTDICKISTLIGRFEYLQLKDLIGNNLSGNKRYLNQFFYKNNPRWLNTRDIILLRDLGNELALDGYPINSTIEIHHINPITYDDIIHDRECLYDPDNLISASSLMHKAVHYGCMEQIIELYDINDRRPNDTCPWK